MGILENLPFIGKLFTETAGIVKEVVEDKDLQNRIIEKLDQTKMALEKEIYLAELGTKTIPWVDAVHKMGRQILNCFTLGALVFLLLNDIEITGPVALVLTGGNVVYQYVKGKGQ